MNIVLPILRNNKLPVLSDIVDTIFWLDFRYGVSYHSGIRIKEVSTLASNYGITKVYNPILNTSPFWYSDGFGIDLAAIQECFFPTNAYTNILKERFLTNNAYLIFAVVKKKANGSGSNALVSLVQIRNALNNGDLLQVRTAWRDGRMTLNKNGEIETGGGILDDVFTLTEHVYYGDLGGADNVVLKAGAASVSALNTAAPFTSPLSLSYVMGFGNTIDQLTYHRCKMIFAANVTGKTVSEINTIRATLRTMIKADDEYKNLVI